MPQSPRAGPSGGTTAGRSSGTTAGSRSPRGRPAVVAAALAADVAGVTAFVVAGRRTHADGDGGLLDGVAGTAWPFLVALGVGWLLARAWRRPLALRCGAVLWLSTVVLGLVLRGAAGGGLAPAFVAVTAAVLGLVLVGWRALAALLRRGTTDPG